MCVCLCFTSMVPVPTGSITVAGLFVRPVFTCHNVQPTPDRSLTAAGAHRVALASWAGLPWLSCPIPSCGSFSKSRAEDHGDCTVRRAKNAAAEALMLSRTRPHLLGTISRRGREPSGQVLWIQVYSIDVRAHYRDLSVLVGFRGYNYRGGTGPF